MANNTTDSSSKKFLISKLKPTFWVLGGLFVLSAIVFPICVAFRADVALYIFGALVSVGVVGTVVLIVLLANRYAKEMENSLNVIDDQLNDFSRGDIKLLSLHHYLPTLDKIQERLNSAISRYSEYRLVYVSQSTDATLKEKIAEGKILEWKDFTDHFYKEVQNNVSYRSALIFIQSLGTDASSSKVMNALHEKILLSFPGAIVGQ